MQPLALSRAVERAAAYVDARGGALARARAAALVGRGRASDAVAQLAPARSEAASLRCALEVCDDLRALADPRAAQWAEELASHQAGDGGFAPGLPLEVRLFETGMSAGHLAKMSAARPAVLFAAADFLARHWTPDRVQGGSWRAIAAYAHCFANADHDASDAILQWCGRELGRAFVTRSFDAVRTARVLVYCDAHALPGAQIAREDLVVALLSEQDADGGFAEWQGEGARDAVASTLDGLVALRRMGG
jgi:hypothetical protein